MTPTSSITTRIGDRDEHLAALAAGWFTAAALFLFLYGIARDTNYGLDERVDVGSARALIDGVSEWTMDHPPLARSLIAAGIRLAGDNPVGWRISSAVAGSLTLGAIVLLAYLFLRNVEYAMIAGLLTLFDNFLFVMSRSATLDTFLMLFLFWGYLLFFAAVATDYDARKRGVCLALSGLLLGLATACKWNGLFSIAALFAIGCILYLRRRNFSLPLLFLSLSVLPALAYAVTFAPLLRSMNVPFTLSGLWGVQQQMFHFMRAVSGNDFINVPWFHWPFQITPQRGLKYLVGNYAVMFCGLVALAACGCRLTTRNFLVPELMVFVLYMTNLLQWLAIPRRNVYYYYYYPCALLLGLALVLALARWDRKSVAGVRLILIPVLGAIVIFLYCYPQMASLSAPWDTVLGYWR